MNGNGPATCRTKNTNVTMKPFFGMPTETASPADASTTAGPVLEVLASGTVLTVTGGPLHAVGYIWQPVVTTWSAEGWVANQYIRKLGPPSNIQDANGRRAGCIPARRRSWFATGYPEVRPGMG
jgi:hypothetical protein